MPSVVLSESLDFTHSITVANIEQHLKNSEQQHSDIIPDTEKKIIWFKDKLQTEYAILYLHGFSATRQESAPLSELVAKQLGANVYYTRLTGHGRGNAAMNDGSVERWQQDSKEAWQVASLLGHNVIIISMSTGSTLATWLNEQNYTDNIAAQIMLSPNFALYSRYLHLLRHDWLRYLISAVAGDQYSWQPINALQKRFWATTYSQESIGQMLKLVHAVQQIELRRLKTPLMMVYSPKDKVISTTAAEKAFKEWGATSKRLLELHAVRGESQHVLAGKIVSPTTTKPVADAIITFISDYVVNKKATDKTVTH